MNLVNALNLLNEYSKDKNLVWKSREFVYSVEKQTLNYQKIRKNMNKLGNTVPPIYISLNHNIVRTEQARAILWGFEKFYPCWFIPNSARKSI